MSKISTWILKKTAPTLREWDYLAAQRPDYFVAISNIVSERIIKYYQRHVDSIIYPPINLPKPSTGHHKFKTRDFYLVVSRLVGYKRIDIAIEACNSLKLPLVIIGQGRNLMSLKKIAGPTIKFIDKYLTDDELVGYYETCRALIFAGIEDFGLVAAEAQFYGKPVICYRAGGMSDIIIEGKTGVFFDQQTPQALVRILKTFDPKMYNCNTCQQNAFRFSKEKFQSDFRHFIDQIIKDKISNF